MQIQWQCQCLLPTALSAVCCAWRLPLRARRAASDLSRVITNIIYRAHRALHTVCVGVGAWAWAWVCVWVWVWMWVWVWVGVSVLVRCVRKH